MAPGYGPSVTVPSVATMLAFWFSSPPPKSHTPAVRASWTTSRETLATAEQALAATTRPSVGVRSQGPDSNAEEAQTIAGKKIIPGSSYSIDNKNCRWHGYRMQDVAVIEDAAAAEVSLDPIRARMLAELAEPHTATTLAARLGLARQKVNYHVKTLEQHGLVELVEERRKGNMTERVVRASAASYVISPAALAAVAPDPARSPDRLSARWLLALAARLVRETGALINGAARANKPLATFGLDAEVRFAKPADRAAFVGELMDALTRIISTYQTETGRPHRLIVAVHPSITEDADPPAREQQQS
jgi:DNA-binding transcriptional ArsR family regulator